MKNKLFSLGIIMAAVTLVGCEATTGLTQQGEVEYFRAQREAANTAIFELDCPMDGCVVGNLRVNNPNQRGVQALDVVTPGEEVAKTAIGAVATLTPWLAITKVASDGISAAQGTQTTNTTVDASSADTTTNTSTEGSNNTDLVTDSNNTTSTDTRYDNINNTDTPVTTPPQP